MSSSKFTHRDCLEKQKPSLHRWQGWHSENSVPGFPQEHEMPLVTNLLIWDTRQLLLEWAFPSTNDETNVEATEASRGLGPFVANSPESWHGWAKRVLPVTLCHGTPVCSPRHQGAPPVGVPSWWWRTETVFSLVTEPRSQDTEWDERKNLISFYIGDSQPSLF